MVSSCLSPRRARASSRVAGPTLAVKMPARLGRAPALCSPSALRLLASAVSMSVSARSRASMRRNTSTTPSTGGGLSATTHRQVSIAGIDWPFVPPNAEGPGRVAAGPFASTDGRLSRHRAALRQRAPTEAVRPLSAHISGSADLPVRRAAVSSRARPSAHR